MNTSSTKHLIIGLIVLIGFTALIVTALKFIKKNQGLAQKTYLIYFQETAGGLSPGSPVKFKGITIGQVDQLQIAQQHENKIKVTVKISDSFSVKKGMIATLEIAGITGESLISIRVQKPNTADIVAPKDKPYPVIPSEPSSLQKLFHSAPELLDDTQKLVTRVSSLLNDKTQADFQVMVHNMRQFSEALNNNKERFNQILTNTNLILETVKKTSENIDNVLNNGFTDLSQSLIQLTQTLSTLDSFIEGLNQRVNQLVPDQRGTYEMQS